MQRITAIDWVVFLFYVLGLGVASVHLYRTPIYAMDAVQYMGNALLMEDTDIVSVHRRVYAELTRRVPEGALRGLLGNEPGAPQDQNDSRRERARNPQRYAEFLPLFAIRPLYNQTIWLVEQDRVRPDAIRDFDFGRLVFRDRDSSVGLAQPLRGSLVWLSDGIIVDDQPSLNRTQAEGLPRTQRRV